MRKMRYGILCIHVMQDRRSCARVKIGDFSPFDCENQENKHKVVIPVTILLRILHVCGLKERGRAANCDFFYPKNISYGNMQHTGSAYRKYVPVCSAVQENLQLQFSSDFLVWKMMINSIKEECSYISSLLAAQVMSVENTCIDIFIIISSHSQSESL